MRLTQLVAAVTAALHSLATRIEGIAHGLHGTALQGHYNTISRTAATLRADLSNLTANTRDLTLAAKIEYAKIVKEAEDNFRAALDKIGKDHEVVRAITVKKLSDVNGAAQSAASAIAAHDEA